MGLIILGAGRPLDVAQQAEQVRNPSTFIRRAGDQAPFRRRDGAWTGALTRVGSHQPPDACGLP
jgi:hypothetical protein